MTRTIAAQTRQRLAGDMPDGATRRVSLHDQDARPIAKGRLGKPVEFGYKAQVTDNDNGVVVDYAVEQGNPADGPQLAPAVKRVTGRTGKKPRPSPPTAATARNPSKMTCTGSGPPRGHPAQGQTRQGPPGRRAAARVPAHRQVRTGSEGRISTLKRQYGWDRTRLDGTDGARTWTGYGILAHNLAKISALSS